MMDTIFEINGAHLRGMDVGSGRPVLFQHGLAGSADQVTAHMPARPAFRRLTLACRAHGASEAGSVRPFSIGSFATDALAFCDRREVGSFVAGGISMGAAIALRLAVRHPGRVEALVIGRPAWLWSARPDNLRPYAEAAALLREHGPVEAAVRFRASDTGALLAREARDNLASLLDILGRPNAELVADVAADGPDVTRDEVAALSIPTLVMGHGVDHTHPFTDAEELAELIPRARLVEIPPKAIAREGHQAAFATEVGGFVQDLDDTGRRGDR